MHSLFCRLHYTSHAAPPHSRHPYLRQMLHAHASRHHGAGAGGPHRGGRNGEPGMEGFGIARKLRSADLQLLIVALLAERPRHGYELIKDIEEQSKGYYAPSPGMIYPALSYIEEAGHAKVDMDGAKKRYSLTSEGAAWLAAHRTAADALIAQLARMGERTERARQAWSDEASTGADAERSGFFGLFGGRRRLISELHDAYHVMKNAMHTSFGADTEEQRRIAAILQRAAAEILNGNDNGNDDSKGRA